MTFQIRDTLLFEDQKYHLNQELLEGYFREFPEKKPESGVSFTGLWRGYIAGFEIKNDELLIKKLDWLVDIDLNMESLQEELFPNKKFEWYSGLIRIDEFRDELDHEPVDGIFEYLEILNGNFIQKLTFNYYELQSFKKKQYKYFLISDEIHILYEFWRRQNHKGIINKKSANKIIKERIMEYTREVYVY